jgi:hypothetical protein
VHPEFDKASPVDDRVRPEFDKPIPVDDGVRPVAVRVRPEFDKAIPVDVGPRPVGVRLWPVADRIDGIPKGAIQTFFGGLKRLMPFKVRDDERQYPIRSSKERETLAAERGAFMRIGTESPGALDSSVPAHESRNRFHPAADRAHPLSAQRMRGFRRRTSALGDAADAAGL